MKFTVRTQEGTLEFGTFGQVELAWLQGLVGPDDDVLEEGTNRWRKAGSIPLLAQARRHGDQIWGGSQPAWMAIGVILSSIALYLIVQGHHLIGAALAVLVATLLFRVTMSAFKRIKPHG